MALLSATGRKATETTNGYLNISKIDSGSSVRICLLSDEPVEYYEVWGESPDGKARPFRFAQEPTPDDIELEFAGKFTRRLNREGTGFDPVKFAIALPIYNFAAEAVQVLSLTQKSVIGELDRISQTDDYADILAVDFTIGKTGSGLKTEYKLLPVPRKKGADATIADAWSVAQSNGFDLTRILTGGNPFKADEA
jgi:hypothetical protein